jgi:hypothetical protein
MALKPCKSLFVCSKCRSVFVPDGESFSVSVICPKCGEQISSVLLDPRVIIDDMEDSRVLSVLVDHCEDEIVGEVASILGFHGGSCRDNRTDDRHMKAFWKFAADRGFTA